MPARPDRLFRLHLPRSRSAFVADHLLPRPLRPSWFLYALRNGKERGSRFVCINARRQFGLAMYGSKGHLLVAAIARSIGNLTNRVSYVGMFLSRILRSRRSLSLPRSKP